jgi:hypothetical protein
MEGTPIARPEDAMPAETKRARLLTPSAQAINAASSFARGIGRSSLPMLGLAIAAGAVLRFSNLGLREMSADEGASWAAAQVLSIGALVRLQPMLNPGKLAFHEIALHGWIRLFGDGLVALRSLSALAGTLCIPAVFFVARELFAYVPSMRVERIGWGDGSLRDGPPLRGERDLIAGFGALIFAVNLVTIKYAQEARMYPMALLFALMQVGFFLPLARDPKGWSFLLVAFFTALAIGCSFTMGLLLAAELAWLVYIIWRSSHPRAHDEGRFQSETKSTERIQIRDELKSPALAAAALITGLVLLAPLALVYLHVRAHAPALIAYAWATPPPLWAPLALFNKGTGSFAFPAMLVLAIWGTVCGWRDQRDAVMFALIWMLLPPLIVLGASLLIRPAFVERYMLASFVPFFLSVALGIWHSKTPTWRGLLVVIVAGLALAHVYSYERRPHDTQWREAVQAATSASNDGMAVAPPYAIHVVRYYLCHPEEGSSPQVARRESPARGDKRVRPARDNPPAAAAIVGTTGTLPAEAARIAAEYPRLRASLRGVIVREH